MRDERKKIKSYINQINMHGFYSIFEKEQWFRRIGGVYLGKMSKIKQFFYYPLIDVDALIQMLWTCCRETSGNFL